MNPGQEMEDFAYAASHDLRAPLRSMENLAQWIEEDLGAAPSPEVAENLKLMHGNIRRMQQLLDDLLAYARAGSLTEAPRRVDLKALLAEVLAAAKPRPGIKVELDSGLEPFQAEAGALGQVLLQLLDNALRHHDKATGLVVVSAAEQGSHVELTVTDDGPGIDPKQHEMIFKLGKTLKPKDEAQGSGVGLALAKKLALKYGASISLISTPGQGSSFRLSWPKSTPKAPKI